METQAGGSQSHFEASVWAPAALSSLDRQTSLRATASAALAFLVVRVCLWLLLQVIACR